MTLIFDVYGILEKRHDPKIASCASKVLMKRSGFVMETVTGRIRKPPAAALAIQVSPEGGDHEEPAGDGASPHAERASN